MDTENIVDSFFKNYYSFSILLTLVNLSNHLLILTWREAEVKKIYMEEKI